MSEYVTQQQVDDGYAEIRRRLLVGQELREDLAALSELVGEDWEAESDLQKEAVEARLETAQLRVENDSLATALYEAKVQISALSRVAPAALEAVPQGPSPHVIRQVDLPAQLAVSGAPAAGGIVEMAKAAQEPIPEQEAAILEETGAMPEEIAEPTPSDLERFINGETNLPEPKEVLMVRIPHPDNNPHGLPVPEYMLDGIAGAAEGEPIAVRNALRLAVWATKRILETYPIESKTKARPELQKESGPVSGTLKPPTSKEVEQIKREMAMMLTVRAIRAGDITALSPGGLRALIEETSRSAGRSHFRVVLDAASFLSELRNVQDKDVADLVRGWEKAGHITAIEPTYATFPNRALAPGNVAVPQKQRPVAGPESESGMSVSASPADADKTHFLKKAVLKKFVDAGHFPLQKKVTKKTRKEAYRDAYRAAYRFYVRTGHAEQFSRERARVAGRKASAAIKK